MILVTGGTGFLGAYLLRYLVNAGQQVRAIKRTNSPMDLVNDIAHKVEWVEGDILDIFSIRDAMKGVTQVYHCAATVSFSQKDRNRMMKVNVEGTTNIVNTCLEFGSPRLLNVSSIAALGRNPHITNIDENTLWQDTPLNSNYAISKFKAECEVWRGKVEGLNMVIINPSVILGSGYWSVGTSTFFNSIYKGLKFFPQGRTGFVDVRDVAQIMIQLMNSDISGKRFIVNGHNIHYKTLLDEIAKSMNKKSPSIKVNPLLREVAWRVEALRTSILGGKPMVTRETALVSSHSFIYDNARIKAELGKDIFRPIKTTIAETAEQYLASKSEGKDFSVLNLT
ncbi:MAG: SDR family NAD(P)-dependent oxidoreductase [Bacteroidota bacterium]